VLADVFGGPGATGPCRRAATLHIQRGGWRIVGIPIIQGAAGSFEPRYLPRDQA